MPMDRIPTGADFDLYRATNPNFAEIVRQPLYDYQLLAAAGAQQILFFQQPFGSGITSALGATVGASKSVHDTNMQLGGTLSSGLNFLAEAIEVNFYPGSVSTASTYTPASLSFFAAANAVTVPQQINDVNTFYQSGMLVFTVLSKVFLQDQPLIKFVPQVTFDLQGAVASTSATAGEAGFALAKPAGDPYWLEPPVSLMSSQSFSVALVWPAAVALPSTFNARVGVTMQGFTYRAGQ